MKEKKSRFSMLVADISFLSSHILYFLLPFFHLFFEFFDGHFSIERDSFTASSSKREVQYRNDGTPRTYLDRLIDEAATLLVSLTR